MSIARYGIAQAIPGTGGLMLGLAYAAVKTCQVAGPRAVRGSCDLDGQPVGGTVRQPPCPVDVPLRGGDLGVAHGGLAAADAGGALRAAGVSKL
jgi:hypothetical protein